jgi:hypothetical protein
MFKYNSRKGGDGCTSCTSSTNIYNTVDSSCGCSNKCRKTCTIPSTKPNPCPGEKLNITCPKPGKAKCTFVTKMVVQEPVVDNFPRLCNDKRRSKGPCRPSICPIKKKAVKKIAIKCINVEASTGETGIPLSGPEQIGDNDTLRFWSESLDIIIDDNQNTTSINIENPNVTLSSRRYKKDIYDLNDDISQKVMNLNPVSFKYKKGDQSIQFGLIAEDVAQEIPEVVVKNKRGQVDSIKYHMLVPLLLNELQKSNQRIEALENKIDQLESLVE